MTIGKKFYKINYQRFERRLKMSKKILSFILAAIIVFSSIIPSFAMTKPAWDEYWTSAEAQSGLIVYPGSNESERNISWFSAENGEAKVEYKKLGAKTPETVVAQTVATEDGRYN